MYKEKRILMTITLQLLRYEKQKIQKKIIKLKKDKTTKEDTLNELYLEINSLC